MRIGSYDAYELPGGNEGVILHSVRENPRSRFISPLSIPIEEDLKDYYTESGW
ncbi:hypothetical protein QMY64_20900 [Phocaeicola dorei]|nr:hypothetical protein QMY64_20900 [Phocaeicola dorei]